MPNTDFLPLKHGFHFSNRFKDKIRVSKFFNIETKGRCGGMAFSALDYYYSKLPIPKLRSEDLVHGLPKEGSLLERHIFQRQVDSLLTLTSYKFLLWTLYPDKVLIAKSMKNEFKKIRRSIDCGKPISIGLIEASKLKDIGKNHQVVAYGYDYNPKKKEFIIHLYDSNSPDREIMLTIDERSTYFVASNECIWRGFFVQKYGDKLPPH